MADLFGSWLCDEMMALALFVLGKLRSSASQANILPWGEIKKFKETMYNFDAVLLDAEERETNSEDPIWLKKLQDVLLDASKLLDEIGSLGSPPVSCDWIGHKIKKMRERIDEIAAERERVNLVSKPKSEMLVRRDLPANKMPVRRHVGVPATSGFTPAKVDHVYQLEKIRKRVLLIIARIDNLSRFGDIGREDNHAKPIVYVVACIVTVCMDPFFLYIPFLNHTKMCLEMNRVLWKVAVAMRTVADTFTALILFMSIDRPQLPQLSRCMSSMKLILLMCVKYLVFAPIPQILFSEKFILKTLGGNTYWNLILFCHYGARLVLIFQACEQFKTTVSVRTLVRSNAPVYLFLYLIVSHVIGASWYYLSIKRLLSCWNCACKNITGCIFSCDGTTPSTLNSTLITEFCPLNPQKFGIYLDALQSGIVEYEGVLKRFLQCFFWGVRNLSSFGSNLHTSTNNGETFFAIIISAVALILLIYIIGNIQRYSELESARSERIVDELESARSERIVDKLESERSIDYTIGSARSIDYTSRSERILDKLDSARSERILDKLDSARSERGLDKLESARSERIVDKMEPIKELIECLVVFHNLDNCTKKSILEHIQEAFENGYKSFNLERLRINYFLNHATKIESVLKDLRFLEEWVLNGQPDNLRKAKKWLSDNIPHDQNNILFYLTCRLRDDEDVNLTSVRSVLPDKSKWWMTMKDLCFNTFKKVEGLENIDEEWFRSISSILKPVIYPKESYIFVQGKPLDFIIFITNGVAWHSTTITHAHGVSNFGRDLQKGDFFGAELIKWRSEMDFLGACKSLEKGSLNAEDVFWILHKRRELEMQMEFGRIPISTADVQSYTQVEAFVLMIEDLILSSDFPLEAATEKSN